MTQRNKGIEPVTIGPWTIVRSLAKGGMARVSVGTMEDAAGTKTAVIKTPLIGAIEDEKGVQEFLAEANIASKLDHQNIVTTFGAGIDNGLPWIAMMQIVGHDLRKVCWAERRRGQAFECDVVAYLGQQCVHGLLKAHNFTIGGVNQNIVHRDVTPKNILIGGDGSVQISDFGVATSVFTQESGHHAKGTLRYMAPEHILGRASPNSDGFSLGVCLWEMLEGKFYYDETNESALKHAVVAGKPPRPLTRSDVPSDLRKVVEGLLDPNVRTRMGLSEAAVLLEEFSSRRLALSAIMVDLFEGEVLRSGTTPYESPIPKELLASKDYARTRFDSEYSPRVQPQRQASDTSNYGLHRGNDVPEVSGVLSVSNFEHDSDRSVRVPVAQLSIGQRAEVLSLGRAPDNAENTLVLTEYEQSEMRTGEKTERIAPFSTPNTQHQDGIAPPAASTAPCLVGLSTAPVAEPTDSMEKGPRRRKQVFLAGAATLFASISTLVYLSVDQPQAPHQVGAKAHQEPVAEPMDAPVDEPTIPPVPPSEDIEIDPLPPTPLALDTGAAESKNELQATQLVATPPPIAQPSEPPSDPAPTRKPQKKRARAKRAPTPTAKARLVLFMDQGQLRIGKKRYALDKNAAKLVDLPVGAHRLSWRASSQDRWSKSPRITITQGCLYTITLASKGPRRSTKCS